MSSLLYVFTPLCLKTFLSVIFKSVIINISDKMSNKRVNSCRSQTIGGLFRKHNPGHSSIRQSFFFQDYITVEEGESPMNDRDDSIDELKE
jgi:hypothetical protein